MVKNETSENICYSNWIALAIYEDKKKITGEKWTENASINLPFLYEESLTYNINNNINSYSFIEKVRKKWEIEKWKVKKETFKKSEMKCDVSVFNKTSHIESKSTSEWSYMHYRVSLTLR